MRSLGSGLLTALTLLACDGSGGTGPGDDPLLETYSFEAGLGDWSARATDITVGDEEVEWEIAVTDDVATDGARSVRYFLDNRSDAGKLWIERAFELRPETTYDVELSFDFQTADFGDLNLWTVIAGALAESPRAGTDLQGAFRDDTGHDQGQGAGAVWLEKAYEATVTTGESGLLYVVVGVWGTFETPRTYHVDAVRIVVTPAGAES